MRGKYASRAALKREREAEAVAERQLGEQAQLRRRLDAASEREAAAAGRLLAALPLTHQLAELDQPRQRAEADYRKVATREDVLRGALRHLGKAMKRDMVTARAHHLGHAAVFGDDEWNLYVTLHLFGLANWPGNADKGRLAREGPLDSVDPLTLDPRLRSLFHLPPLDRREDSV